MVSYKVIGLHIKEARKRANLTQADAAFRANISPAYYGKIERGAIKPNIDRLADISQALNIPFESLFQGAYIPDGQILDNIPLPAEEFDISLQEISKKTDDRTKQIIIRICSELSNLLLKSDK